MARVSHALSLHSRERLGGRGTLFTVGAGPKGAGPFRRGKADGDHQPASTAEPAGRQLVASYVLKAAEAHNA